MAKTKSPKFDVRTAFGPGSAAAHEELGWQLPARSTWLRKPFRPGELLDQGAFEGGIVPKLLAAVRAVPGQRCCSAHDGPRG